MTLRQKITLTAMLIMLIFLIIVFGSIYFSFQYVTIEQEMERIESQSSVIREALASEAGQEVDASQLLRAYVPTNGMIRVIDEDNNALQTVTRDQALTSIGAIYSTGEHLEQVNDSELGRYARLTFPLIWTDGQVVTLEVIEWIDQVDETMATLFYVLIIALFIMIIPVWLAGKGISHIVIKPINRLNQVMEANQTDGEWELIEIDTRAHDELTQLGATYNEMNQRIKDNFSKQEQFVSNASHELKTPIAIIKSYAQLIQRQGKENPEVIEESVEAIDFETNRMTQLIQQMLTLATLDRGNGLTYQTIDLVRLSRDTIRTISSTFDREIHFDSNVERAEVSIDPEKINQVLYILLDNARKYSTELIEFKIRLAEDHVTIEVTDHGEGINQADQEKIFDRFYRVDKARSRETGGTGLGLSIAKSIINAHDGRLTLSSNPGEGSTFSIIIPN
ncbi:ATP-binding protein [Amphibacillus sp. Q70]|uniref:sensor histidine kinase n=1 Tax=Amphibacillus sp. Q70 TaxID=3453416 RepID=UPI003F83BC20